jgi:tetratricopeptide (TPR) repeat protein
MELLDDGDRKRDAAAICEAETGAGSADAGIHAYAGMLEIQLGDFERARGNYAFALAHSTQALEWNIPLGLSQLQRYRDGSHSDFSLFPEALQQHDLSGKARMAVLFALGKAHDDIGDYAQAARYLRQANAMAHATLPWPRRRWRRSIDAHMARASPSSRAARSMAHWQKRHARPIYHISYEQLTADPANGMALWPIGGYPRATCLQRRANRWRSARPAYGRRGSRLAPHR